MMKRLPNAHFSQVPGPQSIGLHHNPYCIAMKKVPFFSAFWLIVCHVLLLSIGPNSVLAQADVASGVHWLASQAQADGRYASPTDLATPVQATSETLRTFSLLGENTQAGIPTARQFLTAEPFHNIEYLARKIISGHESGNDVSGLMNELLGHQNTDGGFGDLVGYQSTVLDTHYALDALAAVDFADLNVTGPAVGFLLDSQQADGGWSDNDNTTSVPLSAQAMRSVWHYRQAFDVTTTLDNAQAFLLAQRTGILWSETFETALALIAILPRLNDTSPVADSLTALTNEQQTDGSWQGDVYTTALALSALALAEQSVPNPDLTTLTGRVIDGDINLALTGATVELIGPTNISFATDASGEFIFTGVERGPYQLNITAPSFAPLSTSISVSIGGFIDLGDLHLLPVINTTLGTVQGIVHDSDGLPLVGAIVSVGLETAITDNTGSYHIDGVPPGSITVNVELTGYASAVTSGTLLAGGLFVFSPQLTAFPDGVPPPAAIYGIVTNYWTGEPIESAIVWVAGTNYIPTRTAADGSYRLEPVTPGEVTVEFLASGGYTQLRFPFTVVEGAQIELSPRMFPAGTTPSEAYSSATGVVIDATTNQPLEGALVNATRGFTTNTLTTDTEGRFTVNTISQSEIVLAISYPGYVSQTLTLPVPPLDVADAGEIRLRPEALGPDLLPTTLNTTGVVTDLTTLALSGVLDVTVANQGNRSADNLFAIIAFYDADGNGQHDHGEQELGRISVSESMAIDEQLNHVITIAGTLPFRDAPIAVIVDAEQHIVEIDEDNNVITSAALCQLPTTIIEPGTITPTLKYKWGRVASTPVVVPLEDTNLDGEIDEHDIPSVVYVTGGVRARSGVDGRLLWNTPAYITWYTNIAAGDLDNDGLIEIVAGDPLYNMAVFEHDGTIKYEIRDPDNRLDWGGYTLADLDGDNTPEIIAGTTVYNAHDGSVRWRGEGGFVSGFLTLRQRYPLSIVADLDLDGSPELISGASTFDANGQLLWANQAVGDGYVAVGNFDDTPEPEIVVVGRVHYVNGRFDVSVPLHCASIKPPGRSHLGAGACSRWVELPQ